MTIDNREIESKWLVKDTDLETVRSALESILNGSITKSIFESSTDIYWIPGFEAKAQFSRLRDGNGIRQLTVKARDKGSNINRLEIDLDCTSPIDKIIAYQEALFGPAAGQVSKRYHVYWTMGNEHTSVSAYTVFVNSKPHPDTIVEIETLSIEGLTAMDEAIITPLQDMGLEVTRAPGSLFEMFVSREV